MLFCPCQHFLQVTADSDRCFSDLDLFFLWGRFSSPASLFPNKTLSWRETLIHFFAPQTFYGQVSWKSCGKPVKTSLGCRIQILVCLWRGRPWALYFETGFWNMFDLKSLSLFMDSGIGIDERILGVQAVDEVHAVFVLWKMGSPREFRGRQLQ